MSSRIERGSAMCVGHRWATKGPGRDQEGWWVPSVLFSGEGGSACLVVPRSLLKALFDPVLHRVL